MPRILWVLLRLTLLLGACSTSTSAHRTVNRQAARRPGPPLATRPQPFSHYELLILSKVLYFVNNNHVRPWQRPWTAFESMVKAVAHHVPGMSVDCQENSLTAHLGTQDWQAQAAEVNTPWTMRSKLQQLFALIAPQLPPGEGLSTEQRLARLEVAASNGLLSAIDAHSVLLSPAQSREYIVQKPHQHAGIGLVLRQLDGRPCVESAIANGPAARAGILPGSILEKLDGQSVAGMSLEQIVERLRGLAGTSVPLTLNRGPHSDPVSLRVVRAYVASPSVAPPAQVLTAEDPVSHQSVSIGYCRLRNFAASAETSLIKALSMFNLEGVKGMILDLRGNPGGLFDQATKVADAFLGSGIISTMVGSRSDQRAETMASAGGEAITVPLVVLVDAMSASASEIVAGSLQQHDRALILGEKTFGNGSVQMLFNVSAPVPLSAEDPDTQMFLKLTTAHFLAPRDQVIEGVGITPDVVLCADRGAQTTCKATDRSPMVSYAVPPPEQGSCGEPLVRPEDEFPVQLARDLLIRARGTSARQMLIDGQSLLQAAPKTGESRRPRVRRSQ